VETGSREENATKQQPGLFSRFREKRKQSRSSEMKQAHAKTIVIDQDGREVYPDHAPSFGAGPTARGGDGFQDLRFEGFAFGRPLTREERIARIESLAVLLDIAFIMPGTGIRYGIDGLIGLIPVVGDIITTAISLWIVREARAIGAPRYIVARMLANVALDGVVGAVPLIGDVFDVAFKANMRNVRLLRRWLDRQQRRS
jgi:hypothetical protein